MQEEITDSYPCPLEDVYIDFTYEDFFYILNVAASKEAMLLGGGAAAPPMHEWDAEPRESQLSKVSNVPGHVKNRFNNTTMPIKDMKTEDNTGIKSIRIKS